MFHNEIHTVGMYSTCQVRSGWVGSDQALVCRIVEIDIFTVAWLAMAISLVD